MGKDLVAGGRYVGHKNRTNPESDNVYIKLLVQLYRFLARRTGSKFNAIVLKRLYMSKINRPPMSLSNLARNMKGKEAAVATVVGTVTDDIRIMQAQCPKMTVCALRFTKGARAKIVKAGGECITFDQLAMRDPTGSNTVLLRGRVSKRESVRHFGTPGAIGGGVKPFVRSKGRKFEKARGRRRSCGYRN